MSSLDKSNVPRIITITFSTGKEVVYHQIGEELESKSIITNVIQKKYDIGDQKDNENKFDTFAAKFRLLDAQYKSVLEDVNEVFAKITTIAIPSPDLEGF